MHSCARFGLLLPVGTCILGSALASLAQGNIAGTGQIQTVPPPQSELINQINLPYTTEMDNPFPTASKIAPPQWTTPDGIWSINQAGTPCLLQALSQREVGQSATACQIGN